MESGPAGAFGEKPDGHFFNPGPVQDFVKYEKQGNNQSGPFMESQSVKGTRIHQKKHNKGKADIQEKLENIHKAVF